LPLKELTRIEVIGMVADERSAIQRMKAQFSRNYATPDMRRKCRGLGATQVFDKSNEIDALIAYCTRLASEQSLASRQHRWH